MKKRKEFLTRTLTGVVTASMVAGLMPVSALAVTGSQVAKDGTYTETVHVSRTTEDDENEQEWDEYDVTLSITVEDGKIKEITVPDAAEVPAESASYFNRAYNKKTGIKTFLEGEPATEETIKGWDIVTGATRTSDALKEAALKAIQKAEAYVYVVMNIPYDEFYEKDINKADAVDVVSSATNKKSTDFPNTYYETQEGKTDTTIKGIKMPVRMTRDTYDKIKNSVSDEHADYYINEVLEEVPATYKDLSYSDGKYGFSESISTKQASETTDKEATISVSSKYGDYEIEWSDKLASENVYGAYFTTTDGARYGLRQEENIWSAGQYKEIAWSSGVKTVESHGNTLNPTQYKDLMGKTIKSITWICADGIKIVNLTEEGLYVPYKNETTVKVSDAKASAGETKIEFSGDLPEGFQPEYSIEGLSDVEVSNGTLTFDKESAKVGSYTLSVKDASGKNAELTADFVLESDYEEGSVKIENNKLVLPEGLDVKTYLDSISDISVNGEKLKVKGQSLGSLVFNEDGTVNFNAKIKGKDGSETSVFPAAGEYTLKAASAGYPDVEGVVESENVSSEYVYAYAGLSYAEYWASEGVYEAGNAASSDEKDSRGESDKGAFDAVTRATKNHGLHRGSFQQMAVIHTESGKDYQVSYWDSSEKFYTTDGKEIGFHSDRDTGITTLTDGTTTEIMTDYEIDGIKYVPVKVKTEDYEAFCGQYKVIGNGGTLEGGFSEKNLSSYTNLKANVTENTNGLKTVTREGDSFTFSARKTGSDSGIENESLKKADNIIVTVKDGDGSYGEFLRVDLTGDGYGDLGSNMQAVKWTYYGTDSTRSKALYSYGTKFAADNWMHKSMGIQLGLTDSLRCQLPEGTDGTGYWSLTVYALGYEDYTVDFEATAENIATIRPATEDEVKALTDAIARAEALSEDCYTEESWKNLQTELGEAKEEAAKEIHYGANVKEATSHLTAAINALEETYVYVVMNIPYDEFYASDINNSDEVDVVSSATTNKSKGFANTYYTEKEGEGVTIQGITVPVRLSASAYKVLKDKVTDPDAAYAIKEVLTDAPAVYKDVTYTDGTYQVGKTEGEVKTETDKDATLSTDTPWGDYLLRVSEALDPANVYGAYLTTTDGASYGLRQEENIWSMRGYSEIAWSSGITTTEPHGNTLNSEHYTDLMGKTVESITWICTDGIKTVKLGENGLYVAIKNKTTVSVADAAVKSGETEVKLDGELPDGYEPVYEVDGLNGAEVKDGVLTFDADSAKAGSYTLTLSDASGKNAAKTADFILTTTDMPAAYNGDNKVPALVAAENFTAEDLAAYLKNLLSVTVKKSDGTEAEYRASGKGSVQIFDQDGKLDLSAVSRGRDGEVKIFDGPDTYTLTLKAAGYPELTFELDTKESEEPSEPDNPGNEPGNGSNTGGTDIKDDNGSDTDGTGIKDNNSGNSNTGNKTTPINNAGSKTSGKNINIRTPKTSDAGSVLSWLGLAIASAAAGGFTWRKKKK